MLDRVHRLLVLLLRLEDVGCIITTPTDKANTLQNSTTEVAHAAIRCALLRVLRVPPSEVDRLLLPNTVDLGLLQWLEAPPHLGRNDVLVRTRVFRPSCGAHAVGPLFPKLSKDIPVAADGCASKALPVRTTERSSSLDVAPDEQTTSKGSRKHIVVDEVRRGIDALKQNAGRLRTQMSSDDRTLQSNDELMQKAIHQTTQQSKVVKRVTGEGDVNALAAMPGGRYLCRVPGLSLLWTTVLLPLWAVVRQAVLLLLVVGVTFATVAMMLVVPKLYIRTVHG